MTSWWEGLSLREKWLVAAAGTLVLLLVVWYGLIAPSLDARADARIARQQSADELVQIERLAALRRARAPATTGVPVSTATALAGDAFKTEVTRTAQASGLAISRLQGSASDRFSLVFEQADPRQLFYWLNEVETRLGGRIERLSIDQGRNGRVRASIDVAAGGA